MSKLELTLYSPHPKQLETHQSPARFKILNWGRRCFIPGTRVTLSDGTTIAIENVLAGMQVISYNTDTHTAEVQTVLETHTFGVDYDPKPMIELTLDGKTITSTYDHEYYTDNGWVPAYQLAWRVLAPSQREKLELLCQQYGETTHNTLQGWLQDQNNETSPRQLWVLKNGGRRQDHKNTPPYSRDLYTQSTKEAPGKSHQPQSLRQSGGEPRVGDSSGKYQTHDESQPPVKELGGEVGYSHNQGKPGQGDTFSQEGIESFELSSSQQTSKELSTQARLYQGYFEGQDLEISARVLEATVTHDLTVENNHNYVAEGLLVHNTGKSLFAMNHTLIEATKRVGRYWIVAPTYRQAKNIYWLDVLPNTIPKELIAKKNESELIIHLINGSLIELKGADNPDSLRGAGIKGLILDEYAFMSPSVWETILRPTLVDSGGWAIFISTPNGFNHFYDLAEYAQGHDSYFYSHATSYDNPHIPNTEIDDLRDDYIAKGKENEFHQEYMGEFRKMSGLVYKTFDRKIHVVDAKDVPETGTHLLSVDFGYTNPMAAVFVLVDRDDNWWVYDELYDTGLVTEQAVNIIQTKMGNNRFSTMVGDSAAAQEIANFNNAGLPIKPCEKTKDSIMSGIRTISDRLKVQEGTGKPKIFISSVCTNLIFEFEAYHYPEEKEGRNASEMPLKENDHALDALRYLAISVHNTNRATIYKPSFYKKSAKSRVIRPRR